VDGRYQVEAIIGEGSFAQVFRVQHRDLGTAHALKLLVFVRGALVDRLLLEGRIQARLRHPNVVAVTDVVRHDGRVGLVMELVRGLSLDQWLGAEVAAGSEGDRRPQIDAALSLFAGILAGVGAAHRLGILHRDLKPANILLAETSLGLTARVSDFGIAKGVADGELDAIGTRIGAIMGTPGYLAPEQARDASAVDARADVFSLGVILWEMLSGQRAFPQVDVLATSAPLRPLAQVRPEVPAVVCAAVTRALEVDAAARFPSCEAFAEALYGPDSPLYFAATLDADGSRTAPPAGVVSWVPTVGQTIAPASTSPSTGGAPVSRGSAAPDQTIRVEEPASFATIRLEEPADLSGDRLSGNNLGYSGVTDVVASGAGVPAGGFSAPPTDGARRAPGSVGSMSREPVAPPVVVSSPSRGSVGWAWLLFLAPLLGAVALAVALAGLLWSRAPDVTPVPAPMGAPVAPVPPPTLSPPAPAAVTVEAPVPAVDATVSAPATPVKPPPSPVKPPAPAPTSPAPTSPSPAPPSTPAERPVVAPSPTTPEPSRPDPAPTAAPARASGPAIRGKWSGTADGRPMRLSLGGSPDALSGSLVIQLGPVERTYDVRGRMTPDGYLELNDGTELLLTGRVVPGQMSGSYKRQGQERSQKFSLTRQPREQR
jgi:serine/threonine protein kinase